MGQANRMKFLILTQYFPPEAGAAQIRLWALAKELRRRDHDVRVVTAMPNYPRGEVFPAYRRRWRMRETIDGIAITRTWIYAASRGTLARLANYWSFALTSTFACLREPRPHYIFVESPPLFLGVTGVVVSWLRGVPLIFNVSDLWPESARALGVIRNRLLLWLADRLEVFLYRKSYRVSGQTEGIRNHVLRFVPADRFLILYNGVDTTEFRRINDARLPWLEPSEKGFVFAGVFGHAQDLDTVLAAANALRDRPDIVFLLVGDGPTRASVMSRAREAGLGTVRFVEPQPVGAMPAIFSAARASLAPLRKTELFRGARPSKIFASMACETPVIFSGEGETARLLEEHRCGIVVPPESPQELAAAVLRLADDPAHARDLGVRGRALVERQFTWGAIVEDWLDQLGGKLPTRDSASEGADNAIDVRVGHLRKHRQ
jgi:putative colanic acid biosynthesis glycosyltransferase WcaI